MDNKTPVEQLMHVLTFNEQILSDKFVKELLKVLDKYIYDYYKVNMKIQSEL
jgi:5'-3' exonuclease